MTNDLNSIESNITGKILKVTGTGIATIVFNKEFIKFNIENGFFN
jgi:hypothetical protein